MFRLIALGLCLLLPSGLVYARVINPAIFLHQLLEYEKEVAADTGFTGRTASTGNNDGYNGEKTNCQFLLGNEVPGFDQFSAMDCDSKEGANSLSYCECVANKLAKIGDSNKIARDKARAQKQIEKLSSAFLISKWLESFGRSMKEARDANRFAGGQDSEYIGEFCNAQSMATEILSFDTPPAAGGNRMSGCDPEQFKVFRAAMLEVGGQASGANELANLTKVIGDAAHPSYKPVGSIYTCIDESELRLMMLLNMKGQRSTNPMTAGFQRNSFQAIIQQVDEGLENFINVLKSSQAEFVRNPWRFNGSRVQRGRDSGIDPILNEVFESIPLAKVLMKEYTSTQAYSSKAGGIIELTPAQRRANHQKLIELVAEVKSYAQRLAKIRDNKEADILSEGYATLAGLNLKLKPRVDALRKESEQGFASISDSRCINQLRQLKQIACSKPNLANSAYLQQIVDAGKSDFPDSHQCREAKREANQNLYSCLLIDVGGCANRSEQSGRRFAEFNKFINITAEELAQANDIRREKDQLMADYCGPYSRWAREESPCKGFVGKPLEMQRCLTTGPGSRENFVQSPAHVNSALARLIKTRNEVDEKFENAASVNSNPNTSVEGVVASNGSVKRYRDGLEELFGAVSDGIGTGGLAVKEEGGFFKAFSEMTQGMATQITAQNGGTQAANQMNLAPFINPEAFKREVAQKDEEIKDKEEEIAQRVVEKQAAPPAEQAALSSQIAALQADLKRLQDERNELERQQQKIATEAEAEATTGAVAASTAKRSRAPASVSNSDDEIVRSSGFNTGTTGGAAATAVAGASATNAGFNTAGSFGGGLGAARAGSVQNLNAALLAANEAKTLTISGQSVPTTNVISLEVANIKDTASLEQLIGAQRDRLQFNSEGWATVEVIDQATKSTVYMQVRLDKSKLVVTQLPKADQQGIRRQVREWTASYKNFVDRLNRTKREAAGVTE